MNAHLYAYLQHQCWNVMKAVPWDHTRRQAVVAILEAVKAYPQQHRAFIADSTMAKLGYGGGI
jgi:hypothetical protein